jgi:hypothetical protein
MWIIHLQVADRIKWGNRNGSSLKARLVLLIAVLTLVIILKAQINLALIQLWASYKGHYNDLFSG